MKQLGRPEQSYQGIHTILRGSKGYVSSKVLQGTQCALGMLGYISKLPLRVKLWNIDAAELAEGQQYYSLVMIRVDPGSMQGQP